MVRRTRLPSSCGIKTTPLQRFDHYPIAPTSDEGDGKGLAKVPRDNDAVEDGRSATGHQRHGGIVEEPNDDGNTGG